MPDNSNPLDYRPPLTGNASEDLFRRNVLNFIYSLRNGMAQLAANQARPLDYQSIRNQLQLGGSATLNITGLPGSQQFLSGTHAQRLTYPPSAYVNQLFYETDRQALYESNGTAWVLMEMLSYGTFENRWADLNANDSGGIYIESSRNNFGSISPSPTYRWNGNNWALLEGWWARNQSNISQLTATFTVNDGGNNQLGARVICLDYNHISAWNGTALVRAPEDSEHSDTFQTFGSAPTDAGWHACDGSNTTYYTYDGNTASRTLPNTLVGNNGQAEYVRFETAYNPAGVAATAPTFAGNSFTPAGTVSSNFSGNSLATHTHDTPINTNGGNVGVILNTGAQGGSYNTIANFTVVAGVGGPFSGLETSPTSAGTPSGTVSSTFTGNSVTPSGTISLPGDPVPHFRALLYYRR